MKKVVNVTPVNDAKSIVAANTFWVRIALESWDDSLRNKEWNDALYTHQIGIPPSHLKVIQELPKRLKEGFVYRPIAEYKDFNNKGIVCLKGF